MKTIDVLISDDYSESFDCDFDGNSLGIKSFKGVVEIQVIVKYLCSKYHGFFLKQQCAFYSKVYLFEK